MFKKNFLQFIREHDLFQKEDKILLAFSSGIDSVVLARLFNDCKFSFAIAHCNFKLREEESDKDEIFAKKIASLYKVPFYSIQFDTKKYSQKNKISIQEAARDLRYEWFEKTRAENEFDKIATAHHLSDSIETFFINVLRGTGLKGLKGIPVVNNHLIRPLLFASRSEIAQFAKEKKLKWREDRSNEQDDYLRNRIRHHLIPSLVKEQDDFEDNMAKSMAMFQFADQIQQMFIEDWKKKHVRSDKSGFAIIPLKEIDRSNMAEALLSAVLYSYGITNLDIQKILAAGTGKVFKSKEVDLLVDRDLLILRKSKVEKAEIIMLSSLPDRLEIGGQRYVFTMLNANKLDGIPRDEKIQVVNADQLQFPLVIRKWQAGDSFYPLGMKKRKKVSDFLVDKKVNLFEKERVNVLLSGNDIVCIFGHRIDDRFKLTDETHSVLHIERIYD
jgi:tRNA(Ile)-lysidine synthase